MQKEISDRKCYPYHMDHLPDSFQQRAVKEFNETPETRQNGLKKLKDLLSADKFTADIEFEEDFLRLFLRYRKYNSLKAFQALLKFLSFRNTYDSMFQTIPGVHFKDNPATKFTTVLPYRCPDGSAVILHQLRNWNPSEISLENLKIIVLSTFLLSLRCPMTQIGGFKIIYDFKGTNRFFRFCTPQNINIYYNAAFNCVPGRYKEIHCINKSVALTAVWTVLKHFLSEKMTKRIFFHSNPKELLKYFPSYTIPSEYGGSLDNHDDSELMQKLNEEFGNYPHGGMPNYF